MGFKYSRYDAYTDEDTYTLVCDDCGEVAYNPKGNCQPFRGPIPWLLEKAQKFGWVTRKAAKRGDPMQWICPKCRDKMKASGEWWGETPKAAARA